MPANKERGEVSLKLDVEYVLRPSYEALEACEKLTGMGLLKLAEAADNMELTRGQLAIIACEMIRAHGREVDDKNLIGAKPDRIGELMTDAPGGLIASAAVIRVVLCLACTGEYTSKGELKAALKKADEANAAG